MFLYPNLFTISYWIVNIYYAITERTSNSILLNSSKQAQEPQEQSPLKNSPILT